MKKLRTWREYLIKRLAADRGRASGYLQAALKDYQNHGDAAVFLLALQTVVESQGGISEIAKQIDINPETLSEMLVSEVLPPIGTLTTVLNALGCQISIQSIDTKNADIETVPKDSFIAPIEGANANIENEPKGKPISAIRPMS